MVLAVPVPANGVAGVDVTAAFWNAQVRDAITFALNPPICRMHQGTLQSVANATDTAITFDVNDVDSYSGHSTVTNNSRYVAQVAGWHRYAGHIAIAATSTTATTWGYFRKNGSTRLTAISESPAPLGGNVRDFFVDTDIVFLAVGDFIEMMVNQNDGAARNTTANGTEFSHMSVQWIHV